MTHPVPPTAIESTLSALLAHPALDDCAVAVRERPDGVETVAYVVRRFAVADDELRAHLVARGASAATTFVSVAAIPYLPDGRPDLGALTAQPLADVVVAAAWEQLVQGVAGVAHVAALVREPRQIESPLHVDDLLAPELRPGRRRAESAAREPSGADAPAPVAVVAGGRPAIADGGPLPPDDPSGPAVLSDVLCRTAIGGRRARRGLTYVAADGSERYQSYGDLLGYAEQLLAGLRGMGLAPGDRVLLLLPQHRDFLPAFWACVLGGFVPVPVAAPARYDQPSPALEAVRGAWRVTRPAAVLANGAAAAVRALVPAGDPCQVRTIESLRGGAGTPHHRARVDDVALLMMTSGSTGTPKAVALTHRNLLARTRASQIVNGFTDADVSLNWMPLDHVAGLIYFHLRDVYLGCHQVHLPTPAVVQDPLTWLDALERYHATVTFAPNFAYGLLLDRERELASRRWDLSSVRYVLNGAEAIVARTARRFLTALAPHGLRPTAMRPAWGMSETSSGVTYSDAFMLDTTTDDQPFVEVGAPIPSVAMRVVDEHDVVVDEGVVGRLQISGATVMQGYFDAPDQTRDAFTSDSWFKTGDLATIRGGRVTVTGREKDVIIVNSVNYYSHAIESVVDALDGVEPSFTAAVAVRRGTDTDSLAIFFVPRSADPATLAALLPRIRAEVARAIGVTAEFLVPVAPADVPKTSLGKIQRTELARELIAGGFDDRLKIVAALLGTDDVVPAWFFRRVWRAKAPVRGDGSLHGRRVVLFDPGGPSGESLRREFTARGASVVAVVAGDTYARLGADRFVIAPTRASDYAALVGALLTDGPLEHAVHAWSTAPAGADDDELLATGAVSVLLLIQAVASTFAKAAVDKRSQPLRAGGDGVV